MTPESLSGAVTHAQTITQPGFCGLINSNISKSGPKPAISGKKALASGLRAVASGVKVTTSDSKNEVLQWSGLAPGTFDPLDLTAMVIAALGEGVCYTYFVQRRIYHA